MKKLLYLIMLILPVVGYGQDSKPEEKEGFKFAYITDTHLGPAGSETENTLKKALRDAKSRGVDFVIFGGDYYTSDRHGEDKGKEKLVRSNYKHLLKLIDKEGIKGYHTPGNHDRFYFHKGEPDVIGYKMYQEIVGELYYSFDYNGTHFIVLNSCELTEGGEYYTIQKEQIEWLKKDLEKTGKEQPIIVSLHVPLVSLYHLVMEGKTSPYTTIINTKEIVDMLVPYNLKVVLQGHNHIHEEILEREHWFITGGATCGAWPSGIGYMLFEVDAKQNVSWDYIVEF